jgi:hypothetical protein
MKQALCYHHAVCASVYPIYNFRIPEPVFMKLGIYVMAPEPIWTAYFINPSHQSVRLYVCPAYRYYATAG